MKILILLLMINNIAMAKETKISSNITMLSGYGGNILLIKTSEGDMLVDSGTPKGSKALIKKVPKAKYLFITHRHADHVGGNNYYGENDTVIFAHRNTAEYLKEPNSKVNPQGYATKTINSKYSLEVGGEKIQLIYYPYAHTDGDIAVYFPLQNIIQVGDISLGNKYNYIETNYGGTIQGLIEATQDIINLINDDTIVIPGHGKPLNKTQLQKNLDMYIDVKNTIEKLKKQGLTLQQVIDAKPTQKYDSEYEWAMITPAQFITSIFNTLP